MKEEEYDYNIIIKFKSKRNGLIVITYYVEGHINKIKKLF